MQTTEALWREAIEAEEALTRLWYSETQEWEHTILFWKEEIDDLPAYQLRRHRTKTQFYQSTEEESRNRDHGKKKEKEHRQQDGDDMDIEKENEEAAHDWKEGERIGEAKHPGPPKWANNPPWNHTPGLSTNQAQGQARWCGTRAVPTALAGESAKGMYPGPKPSSAGVGPDPRRNTGCNNSSQAMSNNPTSRAGTAQHTQGQGRYGTPKACRYGVECRGRNGQCPFLHPVEGTKMWCKFGAQCRKKDKGCPRKHPTHGEQGWCWYGLQCRRRENGCPYQHPEERQQACRHGTRCKYKDMNCPFQHPQLEQGQSQSYWDPHLGVASRQAQTPHQWSTVGEASSEPVSHGSSFANPSGIPCRGCEM